MTDAVLNGYVSRTQLGEIVRLLSSMCESDDAPTFCQTLGAALAGDPVDVGDQLIAPLLGGYDTYLDEGQAQVCAGDRCNAVSVCIQFDAESNEISGLLNLGE